MAHWSLDDIHWRDFDRVKATPALAALAKAACMVEHNGREYARYLCEVFADDGEFQAAARQWAEEEVQHGRALRKWAELADPAFDFDRSFRNFTTGYRLPVNVQASMRGSRVGELTARCVVEIGTSSYYTAIKDSTDEPVLKEICGKIAADEFRHYKLFYTHLQRYLTAEKVGKVKRLLVALSRIAESEDDELAYAFYAAQDRKESYDRRRCADRYLLSAYAFYRRPHIEKMVMMTMKAVGIAPRRWLGRVFTSLAWNAMQMQSFLARRRLNASIA